MKISFIRNIQFTRLIKVNGRLKEFNFRKPNSNKDGLFTVDVIDERGTRIILNMQKIDASWKIVTPLLPAWIIENEAVLNSLIEQELEEM